MPRFPDRHLATDPVPEEPRRWQPSLRAQLSAIVIGATLLSALLLFVVGSLSEARASRERLVEHIGTIAKVLARNSRAAVAFGDVQAVNETLASLASVPEVRAAHIVGEYGTVVASYPQAVASPAPGRASSLAGAAPPPLDIHDDRADPHEHADRLTHLLEPIVVDGAVVGQLSVVIDTSTASSALISRLLIMLGVAALAGLCASFGAVRLQGGIVRPLFHLAQVMREISRTHRYDTRVKCARKDEIGDLHEGFNRLLGELESREAIVQRQQTKLINLAHYDAVTGLSNRHHFRLLMDEALLHVQHTPLAIMCVDLDRFKTINDALGHDVGDKLLTVVGQRLRSVARDGDVVARLGGDEFALILNDVGDPAQAAQIAERALEALRAPCEMDGITVPVSGSIGVTMAPHDGTDHDHLLKNADLALYSAKAEGRNQFRFFDRSMSVSVVRRLTLERALRDAIRLGQLYLVFQPQVELERMRVTGFEALLRWRHPELGEISPLEFIPVAEESGLITEIGAWVLHEACMQAQRWHPHLSVAVNLSAVQVMTQTLPDTLQDILARTHLQANRLELEITESVLLNETTATIAQLRSLNDLGLRIALDDFGTGYSSMAYLRLFPFSKIKIDRGFVKSLVDQHDARVIVRAIIDMARGLQMKTVAEGVEREAEIALLRGEGCVEVQGYLIARPLRAEDVTDFLQRWQRAGVHWSEAPVGLASAPVAVPAAVPAAQPAVTSA